MNRDIIDMKVAAGNEIQNRDAEFRIILNEL